MFAAAGTKDAWDVVMCEVNGAVIEPPEDVDQETKDLLEGAQRGRKDAAASSVEKWVLKRPSAGKSTWQALRQPPRRLPICRQQRQKLLRRLQGRRIFDQRADDEEVLSSLQES